jgi:signal transduction histidine kinase
VRHVPIGLKLGVALLTPLLALVGLLAYEVVQTHRDAAEIKREVAMAEAAVGPSGLFNSLQDERNRASVDLANLTDAIGLPVKDNAEARAKTDASAEEFRRMLRGSSEAVRSAYAPGVDALDGLAALRGDIDHMEESLTAPDAQFQAADDIFDRYTQLIGDLLDANARVAVSISDTDLRRGAELSFSASREADIVARLIRHLLITSIGPGNMDTREEIVELGTLAQQATDGEADIQRLATGDYAPLAKKVRDAGVPFYAEVQLTVERGRVDPGVILATIDTGPDESYDGPFRDSIKKILDPKADALVHDAQQREITLACLALAIVLFACWASGAVTRSITRPLGALTRQAGDMAKNRLPGAVLDVLQTPLGEDVQVPEVDRVWVTSHDEVADVASALNTVQTSALDLAVEQALLRRNLADSFVNLGRRNQNLLSRQIDFITQLERNEADPEVLDNLFRLDHLATRMRRNAESLLVLAGVSPSRKWTAPVALRDVIRAALGEVENYQRVALRAVESVTILGSAAADLAHLLAEIVENALTFSPDDHLVELRGRQLPGAPGQAGGYLLAVVDTGLGMPADELEQANRRLAGAESFTVAPSKYLGHYVAGNLAARHGIGVTLHTSGSSSSGARGRGITATIQLPPVLLTTTPAPALPPAAPPTGAAAGATQAAL